MDQEIVSKWLIEAASLPQKSSFLPKVSFEEPPIEVALLAVDCVREDSVRLKSNSADAEIGPP